MATELDFCNYLMQKLLGFWNEDKAPFLGVFLQPVKEVADNAPDYYKDITNPMDIGTMRTKLQNGLYANAAAFKADFDLIVSNCRVYHHDNKAFIKKYADRLEREIEWEWEGMGEWLARERRRARQAGTVPAPIVTAAAPTAAPTTTTTAATNSAITAPTNTASASGSGEESSSTERESVSDSELERAMRTSPSPSLGSPSGHSTATPRPSAFLAAALTSNRGRQLAEEGADDDETPRGSHVNGPSDDAVEIVMNALRAIMAEQIAAVALEKEAEMAVHRREHWGMIWGPGRLHTSMKMWRGKCFFKITREEWPRSVAVIRAEVLQAFSETCREQLVLVREEEAAERAARDAAFDADL